MACKALRRVFVSGEALPPTSVAKFLELLPHAQLHNLYGPTEATVDVTGVPLNPATRDRHLASSALQIQHLSLPNVPLT